MTGQSVRERFEAAKRAADGRWRDIFVAAGMNDALLAKPNRPCPLCGGTDRFSFTNKFHAGNYFCRHCGHGDGFELLSRYLSISVFEALERVERACGIYVPDEARRAPREKPEATEGPRKTPGHLRLWSEAHPVKEGDAVWKYLQNRGLDPRLAPADIRTHEALLYSDDAEEKSRWPAMLSRMTDASGVVTAIHRTYLTDDGRKAPVSSPKKITAGATHGAVAQLGVPDAVMGIAEGVETALAAAQWFEMAVWAAIGAENLASFEAVPPGVKRFIIFADNDANFVGQEAAYRLAKRLCGRGFSVEVALPETPGADWLDEFVAERKREGGA